MMAGKPNALTDSDSVEASLRNLKGRVSVVKEGYGFIEIEHPVRAAVFAHRSSVVNPRMNDSKNFGLKEGDNVVLDIERSPAKFKARFQAVRVRLLESEVNITRPCYPSVAAPSRERGEKQISNQVGTIDSVHQNGGTLTFGQDNKERAIFERQCIPDTLVRPTEKVSAIFSVGKKVCFDARLVTDVATGVAQWQATLVTTVMRENYSQVFDIDLVAPTSERYGYKSDFGTKPLAPILVPFTADPRTPFPKSPWNPATSAFHAYPRRLLSADSYTSTRESPLSGVNGTDRGNSGLFNTHVAPTPSKTVVTQSSAAVAESHNVKDKPAFVPLGCDTQWAHHDGCSSVEPNIAAPATGHPVLAGYDRPPKAKTPESTCPERAPFTITSRGIGPAASTAEKQPAPQASDKPSMNAVDQRQLATAAPIKRNTGYHYDAVPQKQLHADSTRVNYNSRGNPSEPFSASPAPRPPSPQCLVSAHNDVKGVVAQVHERSAIVSVEQGGLTNYTEVRAFSFYKDGTLVSGDLRSVLRVGDEVMMDFMLGNMGYNLMTHCNMAWQGEKPQGVECVSREAFQSTLEALKTALEVPSPAANVQSPDHVSSADNFSTSTEPEQPRFEAVEARDTDKGAAEDEEEIAKAMAELVVRCMRHVIREEVEALRLEFLGHMDIAAGVANKRNSDHRGISSESSKAALHPRQPQIRSDESRDNAAEAGRRELLDLHEDDFHIISALISEGTQAILEELKALRLHFRCLDVGKADSRCA